MGTEAQQVLQAIAQDTQSEIIRLFIIVVVILVVFVVPLYGMMIKDRSARRKAEADRAEAERKSVNERQDKYLDREREVLGVIKENSTVIAQLKTLMESDGRTTHTSLERIHNRIVTLTQGVSEIAESMAKMETTMATLARTQETIKSDLGKLLRKE